MTGAQPAAWGVVAIVRLPTAAPTQLIERLTAAGVGAVEVTANTPEAFATVASWRDRTAVRLGIGTVRTPADIIRAAEAGAHFLVSPGTSDAVLEAAGELDLPLICGAATPSEIEHAWRGGAAAVKVFPVDCLGGPAYVRAVRAPLPDIPLLPTGGVDAAAAQRYAESGCVGVGVASAIVDTAVVAAGDWDEVTRRAAAVVGAWERGLM